MKKSRLFTAGILSLMLVFGLLAGCEEESNSSSGGGTTLSGKYVYDEDDYYITFNSNNTFTGVYGGSSISGTYIVSGSTVTLTISGYGIETLTIINSITLRDSDGDDWIKSSGGEPNPNPGGGTAPSAPTGITVTLQGSNSIKVSWNSAANATSYEVWYCKIANTVRVDWNESLAIMAGTSITNTYTHNNLSSSTRYMYRIKAVNSSGKTYSSSYPNVKTPWGGGSFTITGLQQYNGGQGGVYAINSNPMTINEAKAAVAGDVEGQGITIWSSTVDWTGGFQAPSDGTYTIIIYVGANMTTSNEWYKYTNVNIIGGTGSVAFNLDAGRIPGTGNRLGD